MFYYVPTKIYQEQDCVNKHSKEMALGKCALIVTGKSSAKRNGAYEDVTNALQSMKIPFVLFDEVEENPSVETVVKASELGKCHGADFVIGIGGGSPLDASKAIAYLIANPTHGWQKLYEKKEECKAVPIVAIPTTCGTGSEATGVSVLTRHDLKTKQSIYDRIFPTLALVDGKYLKSAPKSVICNTAMDALSHLWESALNTKATLYSRLFVMEGLRVWSKALPYLRGERGGREEDLQQLMQASTLAGMAIAHTGTAIPHTLSYRVTYQLGVPHGKAVGRFLAGYLALAEEEECKQLLQLAGFHNLQDFVDTKRLMCGDCPLPQSLVQELVQTVAKQPERLALCPYPLDEAKLLQIVMYEA